MKPDETNKTGSLTSRNLRRVGMLIFGFVVAAIFLHGNPLNFGISVAVVIIILGGATIADVYGTKHPEIPPKTVRNTSVIVGAIGTLIFLVFVAIVLPKLLTH